MVKSFNMSDNSSSLLNNFNRREGDAFTKVYEHYYRDFYRFALYIYGEDSPIVEDVIHDIFIKLWTNDASFNSLTELRAYILLSIRNSFNSHIRHNNYHENYINYTIENKEIDHQLLECEIFSYAEAAYNLLPVECAKVFKLYLEGYKPEEIAKILDKKVQTVYNMKQQAIAILKKRLPDKLFILLLFYDKLT